MPDEQHDRRSATSDRALRRILARLVVLGGLAAGLWLLGALFGSAAQASAAHPTPAVAHSSDHARPEPAPSQNRFISQHIRSFTQVVESAASPHDTSPSSVTVRDTAGRGVGRAISTVETSSSHLGSTVRRTVPVVAHRLTRDVRSTVAHVVRTVVATAVPPLHTVVTGVADTVRPTLGRVAGAVTTGVRGKTALRSATTRVGAALLTAGSASTTCTAIADTSSARRPRLLAPSPAAGRFASPARATAPRPDGPNTPVPTGVVPAGATAGSVHTSPASSDLVATSRSAGSGRHTASLRRDAAVRKQPAPRPSFAPD